MKPFLFFAFIFWLLASAILTFLLQRPSGWLEALILCSALFFFSYFQIRREKPLSEFQVDSSNKEPLIPLSSYKKSLNQSLASLNYRPKKLSQEQDEVIYEWSPPHWGHQLGGVVIVTESSLYIHIQGPKQILSVLQSHLGLKKIIY